ncbi:MAG: flagellar assembly peptidoglycan hydrolase FlgJ [Legionella sp.]|nr:flagellar assembly peptidoglycan hydrolase FlgJ [Legionella sp.]
MTVQSIAISDFKGLNELKLEAKNDANQALPAVAKQFEGIFLQSMLKSMRMGQHFLDESSPFSGKNQTTFQEMLDGQYANNIAGTQGIGLATMLASQLKGTMNTPEKEGIPMTTAPSRNQVPSSPLVNHPQTKDESSPNGIDDFVKSLWPKAKQAASMMGLDPKVLLAQAALETGWGKFVAKDANGTSSNNLFNVKAGSSHDSVTIKTTEYIADTPIKMNASFRKYPSVEHSFNDYVSLIKGSERYQTALANANNPEIYINELRKAGYATDPKYSSKILAIYNGEELNQAMQRCGLSDQL